MVAGLPVVGGDVIDQEGEEWLLVDELAARLGLERQRIDDWVHRGRVRSHRVGRRRWVNVPDAAEREHAWRTRTTRGSDT